MAKLRLPARSAAAKELRRRERETRDNLADFVKSVLAVADESASQALVADEERDLRRRHAEHFSSSVKELIAILADHPHGHVREYRLFKLWQALGSASFIANRWTERIEKRIKIESAARATAAKKATTAKADDVIVAAARPICLLHRTWTPWRIAGAIHEQIKAQLPPEARDWGRSTIAKHVKRLHDRIFSTDQI